MLPPLGRLRVSFPYYSRFCGAAGEPSPGCSVPAEPSSMASNGGPDSSQGNKKRTETTVAPPAVVRVKPKETNRRLPSAWLTGSIAEQHASQEGTTTSRSPSEMLSNIGTVVPAQGKLSETDCYDINLLIVRWQTMMMRRNKVKEDWVAKLLCGAQRRLASGCLRPG